VGSEMAGFDVGKWADQGLVDIVIAGTGSMEIDTKGFKKLLEGTGVTFFPCLYGDYERVSSSDEVMRGISEALLMDEPDGLYLFNTYPVQRGREQLVRQVGSLESLKRLDKTYIVDTDYDYRYLTHEEWRYMLNLPVVLGETDTEGLEIPIKVWDCPGRYESVKVSLRIWIKGLTPEDDIAFELNGELLYYQDARKYPVEGQYMENWIEWDIKKETVINNNILKIQLKKQNGFVKRYMQLTVQRVNIKVKFE
jgi:hypothetical protein